MGEIVGSEPARAAVGGGSLEGALLDVSYRVTVEDPRLFEELRRLLAASERSTGTGEHRAIPVELRLSGRLGGALVLSGGGLPPSESRNDRWMLSFLCWRLNRHVMLSRPDELLVHAGCVVGDDAGAILVSGASGAGKSTAVAGLVLGGWRYVTDDLLAVGPDGRVRGSLKPIQLRDPAPAVLDLDPRIVERSLRAGSSMLVGPSDLGEVCVAPVRPSLIVFPVVDAERPVRELRPAEGLVRLADEAFNLADRGPSGVDALVELAADARFVEWRRADPSALLRVVT